MYDVFYIKQIVFYAKPVQNHENQARDNKLTDNLYAHEFVCGWHRLVFIILVFPFKIQMI